MGTRKDFLWLSLGLSLGLGSCTDFGGRRVRGNGNIRTEDRSVGDFKNIDAGGSATVYLSQEEKTSVKVECDENLLPYIEVTREGDRLLVRTKRGFDLHPSDNFNVYVTSPVFNRIDVSGACGIVGKSRITDPENLELRVSGAGTAQLEIDAPRFRATVSGAGDIHLKGATKDVGLELTGAGKAECFELLAENTKVNVSGAGSAEVYASVRLDAEVSGAGSVSYKGNAASVNQHVSGAGNVNKAH